MPVRPIHLQGISFPAQSLEEPRPMTPEEIMQEAVAARVLFRAINWLTGSPADSSVTYMLRSHKAACEQVVCFCKPLPKV